MKEIVHLITALLIVTAIPTAASQAVTSDCPDRGIVFIAHGGGIVPDNPENTLLAFHQAIEHGAHAIEVDLRGTKNGEIVIMHDEMVDRTTNGHGKVVDQTLAELKKLDAGHGENIPTYEEALQLVDRTGVTLLLDVKQSQALDKHQVVSFTENRNAVLNVIIGVRNLEDLRIFKALNQNLRTVGFIQGVEDIEPFVKAGVDIIRLWPEWIYDDNDLIEKVHSFGKPVWATAGEAQYDELEKLIRLHLNGILPDLPVMMKSLLEDLGKSSGSKEVSQ